LERRDTAVKSRAQLVEGDIDDRHIELNHDEAERSRDQGERGVCVDPFHAAKLVDWRAHSQHEPFGRDRGISAA
jgi:hypothetical protein